MNAKALTAAATVAAVAPSNVVAFDPSKVKVVKQVSTNLLKLRPGDVAYIMVTAVAYKSKPLRNATEEDKKKEPPTLLPIVNLETGEVQAIIIGAVLVDLLNEEYPGNKYVGRKFKLTVRDQKETRGGGGKRYNNYDLVEIEA